MGKGVVTRDTLTGKWCHYYRMQGEMYLYRVVAKGHLPSVARMVNVRESVLAQYLEEWRMFREEWVKLFLFYLATRAPFHSRYNEIRIVQSYLRSFPLSA